MIHVRYGNLMRRELHGYRSACIIGHLLDEIIIIAYFGK